MVGGGLHRMAQRRARVSGFRRSLPAAPTGRTRILRSAIARRDAAPGRTGEALRHFRVLLSFLLVQRAAAAGAAARQLSRGSEPRPSVLDLLGERDVVA